ncbi:MAG: FkbM family methyltransferase [Candidatus Omnitrophica bacterium]|nr:FkbM family methyltransferase [Candidatus Omnitrophota bacterium]
MKNICDVVENWWDYYLVKYGLRGKTALILKTKPDQITTNWDRYIFKRIKGKLKVIFRLIKENRIEYDNKSDTMVIYCQDKKIKKKLQLNIEVVENIERILNVCGDFEEYSNDLFIVEIVTGIKFLIRKNIGSDFLALEKGFLKNEYDALYPLLKGSIVLDIGGYICDSSIMFCMRGAKKVYVYEPHPILYKIALMNVKLNKLVDKIDIKNYGVGKEESNSYVKEDKEHAATSSFGLHECPNGKEIMIKIKPLQTIIEEIDKIDVMKMDCEGAEFDAILSCPYAYLKKIKIIIIEYHANPFRLIDYFEKAGFEVQIKKENRNMPTLIGILFASQKEYINLTKQEELKTFNKN